MDSFTSSARSARIEIRPDRGGWIFDESNSQYTPQPARDEVRSPKAFVRHTRNTGSVLAIAVLLLLMGLSAIRAESPESVSRPAEAIASVGPAENSAAQKPGIGKFTSVLLGADAVTRVLDAYSTARMLRNRCDGNAAVPVCNEEMFLPDAITHSKPAIYGYEGAIWFSEVVALRKLSKRHRKLAVFIPIVDIATTLPFAVNNLRLPINVRSNSGKAQEER